METVGFRDALQATRASGSCRGVFVPRRFTAFKDIQDGLANTIACGEIATDLGDRDVRTTPHLFSGWGPVGVHTNPRICQADRDPDRPMFWSPGFTNIGAAENRRGYSWADGHPLNSGFNTTLPPNNEVCLGADQGMESTFPWTSAPCMSLPTEWCGFPIRQVVHASGQRSLDGLLVARRGESDSRCLNIDKQGIVWICGTGNDTINRFDPRTETLVEFRLPTRVSYTREIEFDDEGNVWTSTSGPARHMARGVGAVIKISLPETLPEGGGMKLTPREYAGNHDIGNLATAAKTSRPMKSDNTALFAKIDKAEMPAAYRTMPHQE